MKIDEKQMPSASRISTKTHSQSTVFCECQKFNDIISQALVMDYFMQRSNREWKELKSVLVWIQIRPTRIWFLM